MKVKNRLGVEFELSQEKIENLRMQLLGQILLPDDTGYEVSRTVWNI